jgi:hypothetical protein
MVESYSFPDPDSDVTMTSYVRFSARACHRFILSTDSYRIEAVLIILDVITGSPIYRRATIDSIYSTINASDVKTPLEYYFRFGSAIMNGRQYVSRRLWPVDVHCPPNRAQKAGQKIRIIAKTEARPPRYACGWSNYNPTRQPFIIRLITVIL